MMPGHNIEKLLQHIEQQFENDHNLLIKVTNKIKDIARNVYADAITQTTSYCMTFKIFESQVYELCNLVNLDKDTIKEAFIADWQVPRSAYMVCNPYYHILLLFVCVGLRKNNKDISDRALTLMLVKLWNGRRIKFIKFCNPDVMRYVIANLNGKYKAHHHETPIDLINNHFVPTLLNKYGNAIKANPSETKTLFDRAWSRITQTFISRRVVDLETGDKRGTSGLAPLYYDANEKNLKISKPGSNVDALNSDAEISALDSFSSNANDELINQLANYIVMNFNAFSSYDDNFISFLSKQSTVNKDGLQLILNGIHNIEFTEIIREILELMFKQLQGRVSKTDICTPDFINTTIQKKFISSKHSVTITTLKSLVDTLLEKIFDKYAKYAAYTGYCNPRKGHMRKIVFFSIGYDMQKYICAASH